MTAETMEAQPFWHFEFLGALNENNVNDFISLAIALIKVMASLSHPQRVVQISIGSVADVAVL